MMKIVATTMGKGLELFAGLYEALATQLDLDVPGIFVSDAYYFDRVRRRLSLLERSVLLKEWELTGRGRIWKPDMGRVRRYERKLGDPVLWNALLADRRIFFGRLCKVKQDYKPRFSYTQMLGILDLFLVEIDAFLREVKPDLILSFGTATLADYLFFRFSRYRNLPFLQLKASKIKNYVALNDTAVGVSEHLRRLYESEETFEVSVLAEAREYLRTVTERGVRYEGAILSGRKRLAQRLFHSPLAVAKGLGAAFRAWRNGTAADNHVPPLFRSAVHENVIHPVKALALHKRIPFVPRERLVQESPFVFYPLHFEPEVSLQVFGRPYQNQIEVVRNIALSVPVGTKVLVKEHPRSLGFRKSAYYRKLLEIPNVRLVEPFLPAIEVVRNAQVVVVVSGTIGLEAAVCAKPVLVLGRVPYALLPEHMVRRVSAVGDLANELENLLEGYRYERSAVEKYICAVISGSVPLDLYTLFYGKKGRYAERERDVPAEAIKEKQYADLAAYFKSRLEECMTERQKYSTASVDASGGP